MFPFSHAAQNSQTSKKDVKEKVIHFLVIKVLLYKRWGSNIRYYCVEFCFLSSSCAVIVREPIVSQSVTVRAATGASLLGIALELLVLQSEIWECRQGFLCWQRNVCHCLLPAGVSAASNTD